MKLYVWGVLRLAFCLSMILTGLWLSIFHDGPATLGSTIGFVLWTVGGTWLVLTIRNGGDDADE